MTARYFVTATGTDQGKTHVACAMLAAARRFGRSARAFKPVMSGTADRRLPESDAGRLLSAMGEDATSDAIANICPWQFSAPLSPDEAARLDGRLVLGAEIEAWCKSCDSTADLTIIEGAGGILSPLAPGYTNRDLAIALNWPVILVSASYVGAISHILSSLESIAHTDLSCAALIVSERDAAALPIKTLRRSLDPLLPSGLRVIETKHLAKQQELWNSGASILSELGHSWLPN